MKTFLVSLSALVVQVGLFGCAQATDVSASSSTGTTGAGTDLKQPIQLDAASAAASMRGGMKSFGGYDYPNVLEESLPMLWSSKLVYAFADLVEAGRAGELDLKDTFPAEVLELYQNERLDVRSMNDGNGLPFNTIAKIVKDNQEKLKEIRSDSEYVGKIIAKIEAIEDADTSSDSMFLETFTSIDQATNCVYGVLKDDNNKRVIVVFRGSTDLSTRDWQTNFSAQLSEMRTPKLLADKLKGKLKERVLVHRGFYNYIFNNKVKKDGHQRYDMILDDIKPFVKDGYKVYVTGHSLGAALSSLFAFKIAGSTKSWIPKPISCISYASPFNGSSGFQTAFTQLEKMGLIRYLRVTNDSDTVPTIPPFSLGFRRRLMKHVGVNLRLSGNSFRLSHPNTNGFVNALRNSVLKPVWSVLKYHDLETHEDRMNLQKEAFQDMYLNDFYDDEKLMGKKFVRDEL